MAKGNFKSFIEALTEAREAAEVAAQTRGSIPLATQEAFEARAAVVRTRLITGDGSIRSATVDLALCLYALFTSPQGELFKEPVVTDAIPGQTDIEGETVKAGQFGDKTQDPPPERSDDDALSAAAERVLTGKRRAPGKNSKKPDEAVTP